MQTNCHSGATREPGPSASKPGEVAERHWVVVGDSFSDPRHSGYQRHGVRPWTSLLADTPGMHLHCFASSGDGYAHCKRISFPEQARMAAQDASFDHDAITRVIIYGGINDSSTDAGLQAVRQGAAETASTLVKAFPHARVEGAMNWYPHELDETSRAYIEAIRAGLAQAGVELRTDTMWILENPDVHDAYLPDNLHPNQHGQNLMAAFFEKLQ